MVSVTTPVSRRPTLQGTTLLNLQYRDGSRLRDQNEDTKQKAQYLYTATQHLTQHRDRNASDNSMNTTPADLQITAETEVLQFLTFLCCARVFVTAQMSIFDKHSKRKCKGTCNSILWHMIKRSFHTCSL